LLSSFAKISQEILLFARFFPTGYKSFLKLICWKNFRIFFWQCTVCEMQFSAGFWRRSKQNQSFGDF
jgi:hypothetical protein